jgi:hypothetical protein
VTTILRSIHSSPLWRLEQIESLWRLDISKV